MRWNASPARSTDVAAASCCNTLGDHDTRRPNLSITVVPDSGTDELTGLTGKLNIIGADGKHEYELEYGME